MMEGVTVHPLKHIVVPKGDIYHALKSTDEGYVGFGEAYFSQIEQFEEIILSPESCYQRLTVAPGLWMAFYGEGEGISMLMDIIPEPHDPSEASRMELEAIDYKF